MKKGEIFQRINISKKEYLELNKAENNVSSAKLLKRIQAFKLMYHKWKYNKIASFLNVINDTITDWISIYKTGGVNSLINLKYKGGQPKLTFNQLKNLKEKAANGDFPYAKNIKYYIEKEYGITYNLKHIHLLCKKNFVYPLRNLD